MASAWLGILGSVIVAALAFVFGRVNLANATRLQREENFDADAWTPTQRSA
jgi:hypothetical protein